MGNNERALGDFDRAIAVKPDYANGYGNRGISLRNLNRPTEALAALSAAMERDPKLVFAYEYRASSMKIFPTGARC